ncbi:MAG: Hydrolase, TatD family [Candidatus Azambacteria bacterium GW2011_GWA2_42_9]|uniref:Hydrolase, TatD family n=3 Tax=Candidatus Azamiibacteriota TaxID=1752741 RepID=A0A0G0ZC58_9BACT|nr:MAG: Hydrolase, TatD family [Candidatus Azambacteria bacterium GW2011_GWB1_42_17]KKS46249.1 MAG: Hydrolase, TatD family [Candidatus Azambacteria bacterium GW2011_GWA1_42_19]KKS75570.1 MAG: Hydrolase, TatD family [Candidatus Azambacteria bacterium GW2011_GWA2_42_9]KKS88823.1 MAG: Hydrolase, TatD family [Parcubacteria group bacterium GW2011_GWC1_43_11]
MKLFDSHCHLQFSQFDDDREKIIDRLKEAGIKVVNVGTDFEESKKAVELSKQYPGLMWVSVGLHPNDTLKENFDISKYRELAKTENVVAIGECGLDYFRTPDIEAKLKQKEVFIKQIELAQELNKPLILHCRPSAGSQDAYEDALDILVTCHMSHVAGNGVSHFFAGSKETAKKFIDLGFYIGFAGPITFADEYKEIVELVPMDKILIETDAPFAAPVPHRGRRNEPDYVEFVAHKIAEWKNLSFENVVRQITENAKKLFNINF